MLERVLGYESGIEIQVKFSKLKYTALQNKGVCFVCSCRALNFTGSSFDPLGWSSFKTGG